MDALISVIIPAYNIENYIAKTLDSVLVQTYSNLEIIVVNDGSKDGTGAVLDAYAKNDSRVKVIHKENGGVTSARLCGLSVATGQYIGFVDGDDYVDPEMYARLMDNLKRHRADISHCGYQMVFPNGRVDYYHNSGKQLLQKGKEGCSDILEGMVTEPGLWNKLYRRELFNGLDQWLDPSIRINEDLLMNFYLFRQAEVAVFEDICPYHYVLRRGSAATSKLNEYKLKDPLRVQKLLYRETAEHPEWNRIVERRMVYQMVANATMGLGDQKDLIKPYRKEVRRELRKKLFGILKGNACGMKLKIMALWAAVWPGSYCAIHWFYAKLTGLDRKYEVE